MTEPKKKGRGRPKKAVALTEIVTEKGDLKTAAHVEHQSNMTGLPKNVIYSIIKRIEEANERIADEQAAKREILTEAKTQGLSKTAISEAIRYRKLEQDVLVNRIEDLRIIFEACDDMAQLDLFGTKAIQKYVDSQKEKGENVAIKGNIAAVKASSPDPEEAAKSIVGTGAVVAKVDMAAHAQPRRVGELLN